jgi:acyl phosphate:glycerol-3-phosphate acyltransferase
MIWLLIAILSYLIGSVPSGYLVARSQGVDIRQHGSRNIGATNVLRVMGKKWGYLVFLCDSFKGFLAVKLGFMIAAHFLLSPVLGAVIAAITCILGHNYTIWLGFKGGE